MYLLHIVKLRKKERKKPLLRPSCHKIVIMGNKIKEIIEYYDTVVKVVDKNALNTQDRTYGGVIRSVKGKLQEHITEKVIELAWQSVGGKQ